MGGYGRQPWLQQTKHDFNKQNGKCIMENKNNAFPPWCQKTSFSTSCAMPKPSRYAMARLYLAHAKRNSKPTKKNKIRLKKNSKRPTQCCSVSKPWIVQPSQIGTTSSKSSPGHIALDALAKLELPCDAAWPARHKISPLRLISTLNVENLVPKNAPPHVPSHFLGLYLKHQTTYV